MSGQKKSQTLIAFTLITTVLGISVAACNKPPTRINYGATKNSDLESNPEESSGDDSPSEEDTDSAEPETSEDTGDKPTNENGPEAEKPESSTGESNTPTPVIPDPKTPETKTPDPVTSEPKPPVKPVEPEKPKDDPTKLTECANKLSVGRIHQWHATPEGTMKPQTGLIVVKDGARNIAKVEFINDGWHVLPIWLNNKGDGGVDLSKSKNFTMTYSSTNKIYAQLRPAFAWSGGDKWAAELPSTGGMEKTITISFEDASKWVTPLGRPPHSLNEARANARGLVFIGDKPNVFIVSSLLIDGYIPACE